jgi:hypothetical protein
MLDWQAFKVAPLPHLSVVGLSLAPPSKLLPDGGRLPRCVALHSRPDILLLKEFRGMGHMDWDTYVFRAVPRQRGQDKSRARALIVKRHVTFAERM